MAGYAGRYAAEKGVNTMEDTVLLPIRDFPKQLTKEADTHIRLFSVTMFLYDSEDSVKISCAGTLVNVKGHKGILTARHVCEEMVKHSRDIVIVGVNFDQTGLPGRQTIGHGPKSIYQALYSFIQ